MFLLDNLQLRHIWSNK